jgi:hypothetical protein
MRISVSVADMRNGFHGSGMYSPVGIAITRQWGHGQAFLRDGYRYAQDFGFLWVSLPKRVRQWMRRFDTGKPVKPFHFGLEVERNQNPHNWWLYLKMKNNPGKQIRGVYHFREGVTPFDRRAYDP